MKKKQNVLFKGTKNGLTLHLNDACSFDELKEELEEKLEIHHIENEDRHLINVRIQVGNRYITSEQEEQLKEIVRDKRNLFVEEIESNVVTKEQAKQMVEETEIHTIASIVRSGQVLKVQGDLLLVGDVNPGGRVIATGNIYIMGVLKGIAHAGFSGNSECIIAASSMYPSQIRIADCFNRSPDHYQKEEHHDMECAYIDESGHIVIDRIQILKRIRPNISSFKGGYL